MPARREVDQWFAKYDNPMKEVVMAIREVILATDDRVDECIKWQAPTFTFEGNIASFFPKSKKHASLMFHQGAKIPGRHTILTGDGSTARQIKLASVSDVKAKRKQIEAVIQAWIDWKSGEGQQVTKKQAAKKVTRPRKTKKTVAKKKARKKR